MDLEDSRPKSKNNWAALAALNFRRKNYDEQKRPSYSQNQ